MSLLDDAQYAWGKVVDSVQDGQTPDSRSVDRTAQFALVASNLSIARSLEAIAERVVSS